MTCDLTDMDGPSKDGEDGRKSLVARINPGNGKSRYADLKSDNGRIELSRDRQEDGLRKVT